MDDRNRHRPSGPLVGLCRMAFLHRVSACQARDVAAVNELIDFPALRRSLTAQIMRTYLRMTGKTGRPGSILEQFTIGEVLGVAEFERALIVENEIATVESARAQFDHRWGPLEEGEIADVTRYLSFIKQFGSKMLARSIGLFVGR
jgi:Protein of unknown function (DUF2939)